MKTHNSKSIWYWLNSQGCFEYSWPAMTKNQLISIAKSRKWVGKPIEFIANFT